MSLTDGDIERIRVIVQAESKKLEDKLGGMIAENGKGIRNLNEQFRKLSVSFMDVKIRNRTSSSRPVKMAAKQR